MEILKLFGVDWRLMIAQLINFAVVVVVLWWFAIKPLTRTMQERSREIGKGLDDAKHAAERLDEVEQEIKGKLQETKKTAAQILEEAKKNSEITRQQSTEKTKQEVELIIAKAKLQINSEKEAMVVSARQAVAALVVDALHKILSQGVSKDLDQKYIEKVLKEFKK
ncbi:MAG: ATP synthase F0 subunit B [Parcubacteria group bacterium]|nr:MAG: ATP synthase F0 subunit B [Parcubacteria group bacterium]